MPKPDEEVETEEETEEESEETSDSQETEEHSQEEEESEDEEESEEDSEESDEDSEEDEGESEDEKSEEEKEKARQMYQKRQEEKAQKKESEVETREQQVQNREERLNKYIQEAQTEADKRMRTIEAQNYLNRVEQTESKLKLENERTQQNIPLFNPNSDEYDPEITQSLLDEYEQTHVVKDDNGDFIGTREGLYDFMKRKSDMLEKYAQTAAQKGQQKEKRMQSKADEPPASGPKSKGKKDPIMEALESEE